jgi:glycine cleavage system H protein
MTTPAAHLLYTTDHEWVDTRDGTIRIGITDFAQDALGDVVYVALPTIGASFGAGDSLGEIESTKSVSEIHAPVSGRVVAVNERLTGESDLVNSDPYGEGWICEIELSEPGQLATLLTEADYQAITAS